MRKLIKVLIIDDSALVRQALTEIINSDTQLEVMGTAASSYFAIDKINTFIPDVITLDVEMPLMDGLTFLKSLIAQYPIPVVVISSLTQSGSRLALRALELGAVEIVAKPDIKNTKECLTESGTRITEAIKAAHIAHMKRRAGIKSARYYSETTQPVRGNPVSPLHKKTDKVIAIGASTGGTEALRYLLKNIRANAPGILITQHMPPQLTRSFAERLNTICEITVKEATDGELILRGHAYIAQGGRHMEIFRSGGKYYIKILDGQLVNWHKPSIDVLFNSVARHASRDAMGIIMTGMGQDGAQGLLRMKDAGSKTLAQDEKSSVIFGMAKEAIGIGAADEIVSLQDLPGKISVYFLN